MNRIIGKPPRPCRQPGCPAITNDKSGYCPFHKSKEQKILDSRRGTAAERGYDHRWAEYSRLYRKEHPLCVMCEAEGRVVPSEHVDHIKPVNGPDDPGFYDSANHQALCAFHHRQKTAREDGAFGNRVGGRNL